MTGVEVFGLASTQRDDLRESTATNGRRRAIKGDNAV